VLLIDFNYLPLSFVVPFTACIIIDYHFHSSSCWLLHVFHSFPLHHILFSFFLTAIISHLYIHFFTPVLCSLSSCSSFYSIHSWVSFIISSFATLLWHLG
jgi:hypothetical protein